MYCCFMFNACVLFLTWFKFLQYCKRMILHVLFGNGAHFWGWGGVEWGGVSIP